MFPPVGESAPWLVRWLQHSYFIKKYKKITNSPKSGSVSQPKEKPMNEFEFPTLINAHYIY